MPKKTFGVVTLGSGGIFFCAFCARLPGITAKPTSMTIVITSNRPRWWDRVNSRMAKFSFPGFRQEAGLALSIFAKFLIRHHRSFVRSGYSES